MSIAKTMWYVIGAGAVLLGVAAVLAAGIAKRRREKREQARRDIYPLW